MATPSEHKEKKKKEWQQRKEFKDWRQPENFGTGHSDRLEPLRPLDLSKVESVNDMVKGMTHTAFGARTVGEAADVLEEMVKDEQCFKVLTLAGAMTVAKMGLVICDMMDNGMVDAIISTGALMAHGFIESAGKAHFKYRPDMKDEELYEKGYDRVYDTLELERNLDEAEEVLDKIFWAWDTKEEMCSYKLNWKLGEYLHKNFAGRGVLKSAYEKKVPVYIPAFTDSEFGLDFGIHRRKRIMRDKPLVTFNPFLDLEHYTDNIARSERSGIFTIGGGVPRNWGQQVGPYLDIINTRIGAGGAFKRFRYGIRICPEPVHWGGLSGSTYSEAVSWGKFVPRSQGGKLVEVPLDATVAWPLIVKAVLERMGK